jgi:ABC-type multidrug transport system permease subunit
MKFLLANLRKDLLLAVRDPWGLAISAGIPVVLIALLVTFFGGERITPKGRLLIVDQDATLVSRLVTGAFDQGELAAMITSEKVDLEEGQRRVGRGDASALLIIPKGLGAAFLDRQPFQLRLLKNPAQSILPAIIEEVLSVEADGAFYLQSVLGKTIDSLRGQPADALVASASVELRHIADTVRKYGDPPLIKVDTQVVEPKAAAAAPSVPIGVMMFPGMLMFTLLFMGQGMATEVWKERDQGVLRRIAASPSAPAAWLAGKIAAAMGMLAVVIAAALVAARLTLNVRPAHLTILFLWTVFAGGMMFLLVASLQFFATSSRSAGAFTNLLIMPLALMGGSMMPLDFLPDSIARVGRLTPNGAAVEQMRALIEGRVNPVALGITAAALAAMGAVALGVSVLAIRRGFGARD